jgi:hypothetical protein
MKSGEQLRRRGTDAGRSSQAAERRRRHRRENGHDCDHGHQLDEGDAVIGRSARASNSMLPSFHPWTSLTG